MPRAARLVAIGTAAAALQGDYGNVDVAEGGADRPAGVALANPVPERALELSFAMLQLFVASQLVRRALRAEERSA